jgi:hypothetical protein
MRNGETPARPCICGRRSWAKSAWNSLAPGSDTFPVPAFYSYTYPAPPGLSTASILPEKAFYSQELGEFLLRYDDMRAASSPERAALEFFQSTYEAGNTLAQWDRGSLERKAH